jgi:hypothetical protein
LNNGTALIETIIIKKDVPGIRYRFEK